MKLLLIAASGLYTAAMGVLTAVRNEAEVTSSGQLVKSDLDRKMNSSVQPIKLKFWKKSDNSTTEATQAEGPLYEPHSLTFWKDGLDKLPPGHCKDLTEILKMSTPEVGWKELQAGWARYCENRCHRGAMVKLNQQVVGVQLLSAHIINLDSDRAYVVEAKAPHLKQEAIADEGILDYVLSLLQGGSEEVRAVLDNLGPIKAQREWAWSVLLWSGILKAGKETRFAFHEKSNQQVESLFMKIRMSTYSPFGLFAVLHPDSQLKNYVVGYVHDVRTKDRDGYDDDDWFVILLYPLWGLLDDHRLNIVKERLWFRLRDDPRRGSKGTVAAGDEYLNFASGTQPVADVFTDDHPAISDAEARERGVALWKTKGEFTQKDLEDLTGKVLSADQRADMVSWLGLPQVATDQEGGA